MFVLVHGCGACQVLPTGRFFLKLYGVSTGNHLFFCAGRFSNFACAGDSTRAVVPRAVGGGKPTEAEPIAIEVGERCGTMRAD